MSVTPTRLIEASFGASCVGTTVPFSALLPADHLSGEALPLVVHLHDAFGSSSALDRARPLYDELWARGEFPRAMIACVSTPTRGGFYIDRPGAHWETLVAEEFPAYLRTHYAPGHADAVIGTSMGGYGALKLVFSHPGRYVAAAAISPAVFAGEQSRDVGEAGIPAGLADLHAAMAGGSGDDAAYAANTVQGRARTHVNEIWEAAPRILIDTDATDEPVLFEGATYLHGVLTDLKIEHEYRFVPDAAGADTALEDRTRDAIWFIGRSLNGHSGPRTGQE